MSFISTHGKTAYHIINDRKPSIKHLHIFGCICYITRDGENLDKMKEKGDPCVMVGYSTQSKGYRVYNKRTRLIAESIHIKFDEIKEMMSDHNSSDLAPQRQEMSVENVSSEGLESGFELTAFSDADHAGCIVYSKSTLEGYISLVKTLNVDEDTAQDYGCSLQQKSCVICKLRLSVSHSNIMATPIPISRLRITKALPEDRFLISLLDKDWYEMFDSSGTGNGSDKWTA
ncbi:retrovirus-related pol polyprotein from transposon TNT 1-94 [Tanacetum coccineum]